MVLLLLGCFFVDAAAHGSDTVGRIAYDCVEELAILESRMQTVHPEDFGLGEAVLAERQHNLGREQLKSLFFAVVLAPLVDFAHSISVQHTDV